MNFRYEKGLIWITIVIEYNGKKVQVDNCILDTGSATTAIDIDLVEFDYEKQPSTVKRLKGIGGGTQEVVGQLAERIIIGDLGIANIEVEFGDIKADLGINGFIGTDVLKHFDFFIQFSTNEILFAQHT